MDVVGTDHVECEPPVSGNRFIQLELDGKGVDAPARP